MFKNINIDNNNNTSSVFDACLWLSGYSSFPIVYKRLCTTCNLKTEIDKIKSFKLRWVLK